MKNRALKFTRSEGGTMINTPFEIYEDQLKDYTGVFKKEVFSKTFKMKIVSRVVKIEKVNVHALFFEDGKVYDVTERGFTLRESEGEAYRWN